MEESEKSCVKCGNTKQKIAIHNGESKYTLKLKCNKCDIKPIYKIDNDDFTTLSIWNEDEKHFNHYYQYEPTSYYVILD